MQPNTQEASESFLLLSVSYSIEGGANKFSPKQLQAPNFTFALFLPCVLTFAFLEESYSSNQFYSRKSMESRNKERKKEEKEESWIGMKNNYNEIAILPKLVLSLGTNVL